MAKPVNFATFFALWAEMRGWTVPDVHWEAVHWLEHRGELAVLRCFRGFGKSTILAVYNAWLLYKDNKFRILHQSESDPTAYKTSRDTQNVLARHELTAGLFREGGVENWWVHGSDDPRNGSMYSRGILSNVTSARCDEAQNDDIEVPRNIRTPEAREQLEYRLSEQTFIMVPGARQLFIGTPHTHDSIYDKMQALGADCLTIPLFGQAHRIEHAKRTRYEVPFKPEYVFSGIGKGSRLLEEGADYKVSGNTIIFTAAPDVLLDIYAGCAWPERFNRADLATRRRKTKTTNYWDSQYQLLSRPVHEIRLDPNRIQPYAEEPKLIPQNKVLTMWLGQVRIVGCSLRWDPSSGKLNSDVSAIVLDLQDEAGRHYWHKVEALTGPIAETTEDGKRIIGGQVVQLAEIVKKYSIPAVTVETNGIGGHVPDFLKMCFKQRGIPCSVNTKPAVMNKNTRIMEALEPLINSGMLWAHVDVLNGPLWDQMKDWNPQIKDQPDDYLDAGAGAVTDQPARIGRTANFEPTERQDWRPNTSVFEAKLEV